MQICLDPSKIICCGVYLSEKSMSNKMPDCNVFLRKFMDDLKPILINGININNSHISLHIKAFVCDSPVRSDLKKIVNHNSYNGCERCSQRGTYSGGHVTLLETNAPLRTDESFKNREDESHHLADENSILEELDIGLVSSFCLDYMHNTCIGITRRLLTRIISSKRTQKKCHLPSASLQEINLRITNSTLHIPSDFKRKLDGGLTSLSYWKATETRLFLLYIGPIVLRCVLPDIQYTNFLSLSVALRLLLTPNQEQNMNSCKTLLKILSKLLSKYMVKILFLLMFIVSFIFLMITSNGITSTMVLVLNLRIISGRLSKVD